MKHFVPFMALAITAIFSSSAFATNYTNYGTYAEYNLANGDTLRIAQGTFNGKVNQLPQGAVIIIAPNANFNPATLNLYAPAGKIINNGSFRYNTLSIGANFIMDNYGTTTINGDMSFNNGTTKKLTNYAGGTLNISGNLSLNTNATIINNGIINIIGSINVNTGSSSITNSNVIKINGDLNNQGTINNENTMDIGGDLNLWGGQLNNSGQLTPDGVFNISAGVTYVNQCRLITEGGINNNGTFYNYGIVWAGTSITSSDFFTNNGTFINGSNAKLRTVNFTNYASITGSGYLYATGVTTLGNQASIGVSGSTTDTIRFYDVTRSNASRLFDNQWGTVRPNVKFVSFAQPDTLAMFSSCSNVFRGGFALPVKWNYFYARTVQQHPQLTWSAEYEHGMQFEIERSYDNINFQFVAKQTAEQQASYSYTDLSADMNKEYVTYRIKSIAIGGAVKYSEVRMIRLGAPSTVAVSVFPNPATDVAFVQYAASKNEDLTVSIHSSNGMQLIKKNFAAQQGANKFAIHEAKTLNAGIYYLQVQTEHGLLATQKLVVK